MKNRAGRFAKSIAAAGLLIVVAGFTGQNPSPLLGVYSTEITTKDIPDDFPLPAERLPGKYELTFDKGNRYQCTWEGEFGVGGSYTLTEERIEFTDDKGSGACHQRHGEATGTYKWKLDGNKLTFTAIEDRCYPRKVVLTAHPLEKRQ